MTFWGCGWSWYCVGMARFHVTDARALQGSREFDQAVLGRGRVDERRCGSRRGRCADLIY